MDCREYQIVEVAEDALPAEQDWMLIDEPDRVVFVVKRGRAAYRQSSARSMRRMAS
jgi:hypothetical protein